ncbi:hypothetical protein [Streptomyces sp. NPDC059008]|uniref:hypothetical protein n=1 Tax=Streptomyces sp. NPDC059008 TaxID=3346693 RepID=UPI0036C6B9A3
MGDLDEQVVDLRGPGIAADRVVVEVQVAADASKRAPFGQECLDGAVPFADGGDDVAGAPADIEHCVRLG